MMQTGLQTRQVSNISSKKKKLRRSSDGSNPEAELAQRKQVKV